DNDTDRYGNTDSDLHRHGDADIERPPPRNRRGYAGRDASADRDAISARHDPAACAAATARTAAGRDPSAAALYRLDQLRVGSSGRTLQHTVDAAPASQSEPRPVS